MSFVMKTKSPSILILPAAGHLDENQQKLSKYETDDANTWSAKIGSLLENPRGTVV